LLTQHLPLQRALRALGHAGLPLFRACGASDSKFPQFCRFHLSRKAGTKMISSFSAQDAPRNRTGLFFMRPAYAGLASSVGRPSSLLVLLVILDGFASWLSAGHQDF